MNRRGMLIKNEVKQFYDEVGWNKAGAHLYVDGSRFEDLRPVSQEYRRQCHLRINRYLSHKGRFLLDVASGPLQFSEYLTYSSGYDFRICGDLSMRALQEAKKAEKEHGLYVQCDLTCLPFKSESIDTALSITTIFHIPADQQIDAFTELQRVIKPGSSAVVVYTWSRHSLLMVITFPYKAWVLLLRWLKRLIHRPNPGTARSEPKLYFYVHPYRWFAENLGPKMDFDVAVWRSVNVQFLKCFIHERIFGRPILKLINKLEEKWPRFFGRFGAYPIILIKKPPAS
jgi:ubiquinone/menaquinone biosynthesis C-methylase UbiE